MDKLITDLLSGLPSTIGILAPVIFITAALISYLAMNALLHSALSKTVLDLPNERSLHQQPVPRIGGVGLLTTAFLFLLGHAILVPKAFDPVIIVITVSTAMLTVLGLIDDKLSLSATAKGLIHLTCAIGTAPLLVHASSVAGHISAEYWLLWFAIYVAILCWSANLYNFMDGSDGLAGMQTIIGFGALAIVADTAITGLIGPSSTVQYLSWCISGAAIGFLVMNWSPAQLFLGDAGSVPLGYLAAAIGLYGNALAMWPAWFVPIAFAPFVADATVTLIRRTLQGHKPWHPHRDHVYQRLILKGFSHHHVALLYAFLALMGITVAGTTRYQNTVVSFALWTAIMICALVIYRLAQPSKTDK